ncbi:MAG TPA: phosphoribosyltransferase family protein [Microcella sp.]|nr:phosphoribosyltransferase family protein [Microcella sp.]
MTHAAPRFSLVPPRPLIAPTLDSAWALVAPVACVGCGRDDVAVCTDCRGALEPRVRVAALTVGSTEVPLVAALDYDGAARAALLALKEEGRTELAAALAPAVSAAVVEAYRQAANYTAVRPESPLLVPVPGSRAGFARRGVHPTEVLARRAGFATTRVLAPARGSGPAQKSRALAERLARESGVVVRGAARLLGRRVVLIDDVVTSGATLRSSAAVVRAAGAEVVACAAVMATPRRQGVSSIPWSPIRRDPDVS